MAIRHLKTLIMIAECGGFSAAAERLFITQSAVSMQMKALEEEWRVTLFDRSTRPPVLNRHGWTLLPRAKELVDQYDALKSAAGATARELIGSLRIGVVPSAATTLLPEVLLRLRRTHPGLAIRAESGLSADLLFKVSQGRLEAAVVTEPDQLDVGMTAETVRVEELKLFIRKDLVLPSIEEMLAERPFIRFSSAMGVGRIVDEALRARGIKVNAVLELDSIEAILGMVQLGLGISIVPEHSTTRRLDRRLRALSLTPPVKRNLVMVTRRGYSELPAVRILVDTFRVSAGAGIQPDPRPAK
ncbi:LysR family transcriptional regulator [Roseococcus pinisoli]|uniref:LysR family transcriptional regulator n=1 Tax=Roseococcus pinisoli TaxID=2835040 RepID=A0ABS5QHD1_9PROT|nr:LysR family transcriptional regulator [Roseococcus pinisoli]MBS7813106.1 LysR family transcriptional regulator [Roseococcus pinisoli]